MNFKGPKWTRNTRFEFSSPPTVCVFFFNIDFAVYSVQPVKIFLKNVIFKGLKWTLFGNHSGQLPRLIEKLPQWLSGPSLVLPAAAGSPAGHRAGFKQCSDALQFLFNYWHGLTKNA
jgi:hypothetical protein